MIYDDDNIEQIGDDEYIVINYENDTIYLINHTDTVINGKHIVIDTCIKRDTVYIERSVYDTELKIIEQIINRPDFGKSILSILVLVFVSFVILKKRFKK